MRHIKSGTWRSALLCGFSSLCATEEEKGKDCDRHHLTGERHREESLQNNQQWTLFLGIFRERAICSILHTTEQGGGLSVLSAPPLILREAFT